MKSLTTSIVILLASCSPKTAVVPVPGREVFDEFQAVMVSEDFEKLAAWLDPEVLRQFRRQLEFTTEQPQEGSWFSGTIDKRPTPEELLAVTDSDFFIIYMKGTTEVIGNPLAERYRGGKIVAAITGSKGYRHCVLTKDDDYAFPSTFSFKPSGKNWMLVEPSVISTLARQLGAVNGGSAK